MVRRGNRKYHDRVAGRYDQVYDSAYWRFYRDLSWRHLKRYLPAERPARAADLGCGTGWFGLRLLKTGFDTVFLDPSGKMLDNARDAVEEQGQRGRQVEFVQAGMEDMSDIESDSLAFATAQGDPLSFCEDPLKALHELRRILGPGGAAVLSVDSRIGGVRSEMAADQFDAAIELLKTGRTSWRGDRREERFPMKMFDPEELEKLLEKAGFEVLSRIAKTCLVQRKHEEHLEDPKRRRELMDLEESVHAKPHWFGLASHFQVAARRR